MEKHIREKHAEESAPPENAVDAELLKVPRSAGEERAASVKIKWKIKCS